MSKKPSNDLNWKSDAARPRFGNRPTHLESGYLQSRVLKRSIVVGRHKTSVSLEDVFWNELRAMAHERGLPLSQLVALIDEERRHGNLSSAIRIFIFESVLDAKNVGNQIT